MRFTHYPVPTCCPYCKAEEILHTTNDYLYGRLFAGRNGSSMIYVCVICKASVGTHADGYTPLGRLADKELKTLKKQAHDLLDPHHGFVRNKRRRVYAKLAKRLGIPLDDCHIGFFDETMTRKAIKEIETWRKPRKLKNGGFYHGN